MEHRKIRRRGVQVTYNQKKKLIEFVSKNPQLISCKVTPEFNYRDSQKLWQTLANECNALPGAKKTWRQWRKTWQDLRSKTKKRQVIEGMFPNSVVMLTQAEQEALGIKNTSSSSSSNNHESTEFVQLEQNEEDNFNNLEMETKSEPDSSAEVEDFPKKKVKIKNNSQKFKHRLKHSNNCVFNCDLLAVHERRKVELKEEYIKFKKNYLRQKLKLMKEQTEALKVIAKELSDM